MAFGDFFTSPRERAGRDQGKALQDEAANLSQSFSNISSLDDVYKNYGVKKFDLGGYKSQVKKAFDPARRTLATRLGQAKSSIFDRSGRSATPGMKASAVEGDFANAFSGLEGQQANQELAGYDKESDQNMSIAQLFQSLLQNKDAGAVNKLGAKNSTLQTYLNSLSGTSGFDDLLAGASAVGSIATGLGTAGGKKGIKGLWS